MFAVWLPEPLYRIKPFALAVGGIVVGVMIDNPYSYFGGGMLTAVGLLILKMRYES